MRDLSKKDLSVDKEKGFEPKYEISADKKKTITELKKIAKDAEIIWLATDEDREGEAISWHLIEALGLDEKWAYNIVKQVGNYGEVFERNVGVNTPLKLERGLNAQWTNGGLMYAPPFK